MCWIRLVITFSFATLSILAPLSHDERSRQNQRAATERLMACLNHGDHGNFTFRLRDVQSDVKSDGPIELVVIKVTVQETECMNGENFPALDCPFKADGAVKFCAMDMDIGTGSIISANCSDSNNVTDQINKIHRLKRAAKNKKNSTATSGGSSISITSCLECIFDIMYDG
ncbi:hypothetical protein GDO86_012057 [Hymenochirus boettgeri]|uniref:Uncharacterized protein n=1 Tax=Hymenochirus boettgeri TaxID=247094 RepID=A0A8T2JLM2_9PIPI|nr:hypothetical protein GDO86_012057 [Hymenochirus boettgeri]